MRIESRSSLRGTFSLGIQSVIDWGSPDFNFNQHQLTSLNMLQHTLKLGFDDRSMKLLLGLVVCCCAVGSTTAQENDRDTQSIEASLHRIDFDDLPEVVRRRSREEFPDKELLAVEKSSEDGQVIYHVMFEVEGTEAGLRLDARGKILDRWHVAESLERNRVEPTFSNIKYGPHERNVFDLWKADSARPTPLLICIHGGGFSMGDKSGFHEDHELIGAMRDAGISVAAINYRLTEDGKNPYPIPMHDGARAVQYLRHHAKKYNLDKSRFGALGGSAGGCMLMWLGFHDDLARSASEDPVCRESSRLQVLAPINGQSCLHLPTLEDWFAVDSLEPHPAYWPLFGVPEGQDLDTAQGFGEAMKDASPITHLSADDPLIYLLFGDNEPVGNNPSPGLWVHHPTMGVKLKEAMDSLGIECHVEFPGKRSDKYSSQIEFLIAKLTKSEAVENHEDREE